MATDSTVCIAASYEAKAFGVRTGTGVKDAKQMCPLSRSWRRGHDIVRARSRSDCLVLRLATYKVYG